MLYISHAEELQPTCMALGAHTTHTRSVNYPNDFLPTTHLHHHSSRIELNQLMETKVAGSLFISLGELQKRKHFHKPLARIHHQRH